MESNYLDKFPQEINRKTCFNKMKENQNLLLKRTRKEFTDIINKSVDECDQVIELVFPSRLWHEHRLTLSKELLDQFGKIKVRTNSTQCDVTISVISINEVPPKISKVFIEFYNE